jgi:hypothetical protein
VPSCQLVAKHKHKHSGCIGRASFQLAAKHKHTRRGCMAVPPFSKLPSISTSTSTTQALRTAQCLLYYTDCQHPRVPCCHVLMLYLQRMRTRLLSHFQSALEACDVIMTPATPTTAPVLPPQANTTGAHCTAHQPALYGIRSD